MKNINNELIKFIKDSPSQFQAVENISNLLNKEGYKYLKESSNWSIKSGKFYTIRNGSSIIAFDIPKKINDYHYQLCASHSDSPTFKIKCESELSGPNEYLKLNVERYGGAINYTWLDKPLSVAGRIIYKDKNKTKTKNIYIDKDILIIPSMPIHMNREVNKGYEFNPQIDLCPLFSNGELKKGDFIKMLSKESSINEKDIIAYDLYLVNRQEGKLWGYKDEFISSPKLDDLQAAYTSLIGFIDSKENDCIKVYCCFDNEEVGSVTKQGAMSTFLKDTLCRINSLLKKNDEDYHVGIAKSFMVSFDNAHAVHPNHSEKFDQENRCYMNKGVVIKENASQSYTTDSFSRAIFKQIAELAKVPTQVFANRSDERGGSTLGNISNTQVSLHAVDIGVAELAMHSNYETAGSKDSEYAYKAIKEYYSRCISIEDSLNFSIK